MRPLFALLPVLLASASALARPAPQERIPFDPRYEARITPEVRVVRQAAPAVVYVETTWQQPVVNLFSGRRAYRPNVMSGSGVVISTDGYVITNFHVVANARENDRIQVRFDNLDGDDSEFYDAKLISYEQSEDLALLKIDAKAGESFPIVELGDSSDLMIGERVIAIGNPFHRKLTVSSGIISGLHRSLTIEHLQLQFDDLIQTDASINPGNSGGPLLNIHGDLIGITTLVKAEAENMGYAIPVDRVRNVLANRLFSPEWERTWLGFDLRPEGPEGAGTAGDLLVGTVVPGGPADLAGLPSGARLVAMDGRELESGTDFLRRRLLLEPGERVQLTYEDAGRTAEVALQGWRKVDGVLYARLGLTVQMARLRRGLARYTVLAVQSVAADSPAAAMGLQVGDVIEAVQVEGQPNAWTLHRERDFADLVGPLESGARIWIEILRDENGDRQFDPSQEIFKGSLDLR